MIRHFFLILLSAVVLPLGAEGLSLDSCRRLAVENYPLIRQFDLVGQSEKYSVSSVMRRYLPQITLNGQATYQSDVTTIDLGLPQTIANSLTLPELSKDQYRAGVDVTQILWDGGALTAQRQVVHATAEVERGKVDVSLHEVQGQIDQLYFGIFALSEQLLLLSLAEDVLRENREMVAGLKKSGVAYSADVDLIDIEILRLKQQQTEMQATRESYLRMLSLFINRELADETTLSPPQEYATLPTVNNRPELRLIQAQDRLFEAQSRTVTARSIPTLGLFAQGGYGRPGLDMLSNEFQFYAIGGIKLSWNIGSLYTQRPEQRAIAAQRKILTLQQEAFLFNSNVEETRLRGELSKLREIMRQDDEMIALYERVALNAQSKYKYGVYQLSEMIGDLTAASRARQLKALHHTQYLMIQQQYRHLMND